MTTTGWILLALVVALLFGLSFVVKALLWVAIIAAVVWAVAFFMKGASRTLNA